MITIGLYHYHRVGLLSQPLCMHSVMQVQFDAMPICDWPQRCCGVSPLVENSVEMHAPNACHSALILISVWVHRRAYMR